MYKALGLYNLQYTSRDKFAAGQSFLVAYSISWVSNERTGCGSIYVNRTATNEWLADRLSDRYDVQGGLSKNKCHYILKA